MKNINKKFKLLLVTIQWFISVVTEKMAIRDTWSFVAPADKKMKVMEKNYGNEQLAKHVNGSDLYDYFIILVNFITRRSRYGTYYMMMSMPTVTQVIIATYDEKSHWGDRHAQMFGRLNACTANALIPIV